MKSGKEIHNSIIIFITNVVNRDDKKGNGKVMMTYILMILQHLISIIHHTIH